MATGLHDLCMALLGGVVKKHLEPRCNNLPLWDNGLWKFAEGLVKASVPNVTGDDIAAGVLAAMGVGHRRIGRLPRPSQHPASQPDRVIDVQAEVIP